MNRIFLDRAQLQHDPDRSRPGLDPVMATLDRDQRHYLTKVLRLKAGATITAQLPTGERWLAQLVGEGDRLCLGQPLPELPPEPVSITLVAALPKTGFDEVVRQATELGVGSIVPVFSDRTVPKPKTEAGHSPARSQAKAPVSAASPSAPPDPKRDRWQRIAQEAAEQCERREIPSIQAPQRWSHALTNLPQPSWRYLCVARDLASLGESWADRSPTPTLLGRLQQDLVGAIAAAPPPPVVLAIGPEGGWTVAEIEAAIAAGFTPVSLGPRILRAVTAPLVALTTVAAAVELRSASLAPAVPDRPPL